jgi:phage-related protein
MDTVVAGAAMEEVLAVSPVDGVVAAMAVDDIGIVDGSIIVAI